MIYLLRLAVTQALFKVGFNNFETPLDYSWGTIGFIQGRTSADSTYTNSSAGLLVHGVDMMQLFSKGLRGKNQWHVLSDMDGDGSAFLGGGLALLHIPSSHFQGKSELSTRPSFE